MFQTISTEIYGRVTGNDAYSLYRRRSPDDNGRTITRKVKRKDFGVNNSWIVPYSPLISKTFNTHCNVEYCNSVKSIKYICKYVTKRSGMAVFGIQTSNTNDEITRYQVGRYVNRYAHYLLSSFPHASHRTHLTCDTNRMIICQKPFYIKFVSVQEIPILR